MKAREQKQSEEQLSTLFVQLKLTSTDGKTYKTDCVNTEAAFRIIQSIPSPKATFGLTPSQYIDRHSSIVLIRSP